MLDKINVSRVLADHFRTLRDFGTGGTSTRDIILFYGLPLIVAGFLCFFKALLNKDMVEALVAAYAILVGMLLNLLVLILTVIKREKAQSSNPDIQVQFKVKLELLEETFANISYCTLLGLLMTCVLVLCLVHVCWLQVVACFLIYFGSGNLVLTLLMVLKRVHLLLSKELPKSG